MQTLSNELLVYISAHLGVEDLARISAVSHHWREIALDRDALKRRFLAQPLTYPVLLVGKDLLFGDKAPSLTEVLRFIRDTREAMRLLGVAYARCGLVQDPEVYFFDEDGPMRFLWAACATNNPYLAQAIYHGCALYTDAWNKDIYYDLLFRHGLWEEAVKSLPGPKGNPWPALGHGKFLVHKVPEKFRSILFYESGIPGENLDIAGFRRVCGYEGITRGWERPTVSLEMVYCPYIPAWLLASVIEGKPNQIDALCAAFACRGLDIPPPYKHRDIRMPFQQGFHLGKTECIMAFMREGRLEEDVTPLLELCAKI